MNLVFISNALLSKSYRYIIRPKPFFELKEIRKFANLFGQRIRPPLFITNSFVYSFAAFYGVVDDIGDIEKEPHKVSNQLLQLSHSFNGILNDLGDLVLQKNKASVFVVCYRVIRRGEQLI
jgi:hypothetical protein